jgi:hypothetical protein
VRGAGGNNAVKVFGERRSTGSVPIPFNGIYPIARSQPLAEGVLMKRKIAMLAATSVLAFSSLLVGCDRTVSKTESSSVSSDGTVKSKEKTVTEKADGTVTKTEETKKTSPTPPP